MAVDPRQVLAAFLTLSMFAMLGNMIKRDHFDTVQVRLPEVTSVRLDVVKIEQQKGIDELPKLVKGPWKESSSPLKPCWTKPASNNVEQSRGYITFSLINGPEYHASQIADAVVITRYLGATLVLPDIRGSELGQKRNFQDVYDTEKFIQSFDGVVKIVDELPAALKSDKPAVVRIHNRVSEDFIAKVISPIFRSKGHLRLAISFHSVNMKTKEPENKDLDSTVCIAMFGSLMLKQDILEVADRMVARLRTLSRKSDGRFIAIDLKVDNVLENKVLKDDGSSGRKYSYGPQEVGGFLRKLGFEADTTVYLTQTWWHDSLNILREIFPKTYTKDDIIPADVKGKFLGSASGGLERALDLHICSQSDVFVPATSGVFYEEVAGRRIVSQKTQILVPAQVPGSWMQASDYISSYISKKNHLAYTCLC